MHSIICMQSNDSSIPLSNAFITLTFPETSTGTSSDPELTPETPTDNSSDAEAWSSLLASKKMHFWNVWN